MHIISFLLKKSIAILTLLIFNFSLSAQEKLAIGGGGSYNFPLESSGFNFKAMFPLTQKLQALPGFRYYPTSNAVSEYFGSLQVNYLILNSFRSKSYNKAIFNSNLPALYTLASFEYNHWFNYQPTKNTKAKENNFLGLVGAGIAYGRQSIRIYAELKYNPLWNESNTDFGVMVFPGFFKLKNSQLDCPKIK